MNIQQLLWNTNMRMKTLESHYAGYVELSAVKIPTMFM